MERDIKAIVQQMTLEEKASLCSGLDFWNLKRVERLGIPSVMVTDGPHGLRKQKASADHLGVFDSIPSTCFPSAAGMASSWDRELMKKVGNALGKEAQAEDVAVLLGPGANIKRSPLCGRNFEYFSEDPYLSSQMAASQIKGIQSQGVGTSLKHFAVNNQEDRRMSVDAVVDERTLREIYLASFEAAVKQGKPWTVMCSYNKVNGQYASENSYLLTDILRDEWGFEGYVVSDWGAVNERVEALRAGLDLEMPSSGGFGDAKIVEAVKSGKLSEETLNQAVERIVRVTFMFVDHKKGSVPFDKEAHHRLARSVAGESMVLLKNEGQLLPLAKGSKIAIIGALAQSPRYQGSGSSHIIPTQLDIPLEEIRKIAGDSAVIQYAEGYSLESDDMDENLIHEASKLAGGADVTIIFAGLPSRYESEGYDRTHMQMPENQNRLIDAIASVQSNVVVVLMNGSPIEMPWLGKAGAVLESYLGGQAAGGAIADLLFGVTNPSGKLAETFPVKLADNPSFLNFPGELDRVEYREGIFVGYRYYDKKEIAPLFPFGHGLSYTTFEYSNLMLDQKQIFDTDTVSVTVKVKNTGSYAGKEIVQLYVKDNESTVIRPQKELKQFVKIELQPGEELRVTFTLDKRAFAYYNVDLKDWHVESGEFSILIGKSSQNIVLEENLYVKSTVSIKKVYHRNSLLGDMMSDPDKAPIVQDLMKKLQESMGISMSEGSEGAGLFAAMLKYLPLRNLVMFTQGAITEEMLDNLIQQFNHSQ